MNVLLRTDDSIISSRRKVVLVSQEFFSSWWAESKPDEWQILRCDRGLPEGARLIGVALDPERQMFKFVFEHESFPELLSGDLIPELRVQFSTRYKE